MVYSFACGTSQIAAPYPMEDIQPQSRVLTHDLYTLWLGGHLLYGTKPFASDPLAGYGALLGATYQKGVIASISSGLS